MLEREASPVRSGVDELTAWSDLRAIVAGLLQRVEHLSQSPAAGQEVERLLVLAERLDDQIRHIERSVADEAMAA